MWTTWLLPFVALVAAIPSEIAFEPSLTVERDDHTSITQAELDEMKFFMEQSASAYCNIHTPVGDLVRCDRDGIIGGKCPSIQDDGVRVLWAYSGPVTKVAAYIGINDVRKQIVFTGRATLTWQEWFVNINLVKKPYEPAGNDAMVHTGFYDAWQEMVRAGAIDAIEAALLDHPDYRIVATGHSLGGALASMAAPDLRNLGYTVDLYTYGAPRVGNAAFNHFLMDQPGLDYRVTNLDDPVPRVPWLCNGYRSISPEYWISEEFTGPDYPRENIKICEGDANLGCNGGTTGLNFTSHSLYFGLYGCLNLTEIIGNEDVIESQMTEITAANRKTATDDWENLVYCLANV